MHEADRRAVGVVRRDERLDHAPVEAHGRQRVGIDQLGRHRAPPQFAASALKRRMFSVIAISVGRRSMLDAPKKPTTPVGAVEHVLRVLGLGERPAVAEHDHVRVHLDGGVAHRLDQLDALVQRARRLRADRALRRQPHVRARARRRPPRSSPPPTRGRTRTGRSAGPARRPRGSSRPRARSPCRSPPGSRGTSPSISPTVGKFCTPANPASSTWRRKRGISRNGSVPQTPASTGVSLHDRQHLAAHLHHDRVRVAVRHQPGQRAAARHPVAAGVVDDDQVGAALLGALGREAGAGAGADDHAAGVERRAQLRACLVAGHRRYPSSLSAIASANSGSLTLQSISTSSTCRAEAVAQRLEQRRVGVRVVERLALGVDHRDAPQRHEQRGRAGRGRQLARDPPPELRALLARRAHQRHRRVVHVQVALLELRRHGVAARRS